MRVPLWLIATEELLRAIEPEQPFPQECSPLTAVVFGKVIC